MSSHQTVDSQSTYTNDVSTSGVWDGQMNDMNPRRAARQFLLVPAVAALLPWTGFATTQDTGYWAKDQHASSATVATELQTTVGTAVSRAEAMHIARQILVRAEKERLTLAETVARRSIQLVDG